MCKTSISTRVLSVLVALVLVALVLLAQFVPASGIQHAFAEGGDGSIPGATDETNGQDSQITAPTGTGLGGLGVDSQAVPGETVTTEVTMSAGETKEGNFTIGNGGVVFGPANGTANINNGTVTNNAVNSRSGGYSGTNGSAFIARGLNSAQGPNSLAFDGVTINSAANTLVFNIWGNCALTANDVTLSGSKNSDNTVPFLMIGGYPNGPKGTLTFTGASSITGATGSVVGGSNNSVINVDGGTLTIADSDIKFSSGATIVVKSGATLEVTNASLTDVKIDNYGKVNVSGSDLNNCVIKTREDSVLNISDSKLHDSTRNSQETMIHTAGANAAVTISGTEICNNKNTMGQGNPGASIIKVQNGTLSLSKVNVHDNRCETRGGAFYLTDSTLTVDGESTFENNSAQFLGGVFYLESTSATFGASTFKNNGTKENQGSTNQGAAIYSGNTKGNTERLLQFNGTKFENNCAWRENGTGTVYVHGKNAVIEMYGVKFIGNEAFRRGGGFAMSDNAHATISDLNGDPTEFKGNKVDSGVDFSGGGLFVDTAFVKMQDAAIYGNSAPDAGGAVSTCSTGTAQVWSLHGAAIFDNTLTNAGAKVAHPDIANYQDLYVLTKNHRDVNTGELVDGRNNFNIDLQFELVERMFNGGLHRWGVKNLNTTQGGHTFHSLIAQSDVTNKDVSKAKVVFTQNSVTKASNANGVVSGGAIGCNGLLEIGTDTEIKVVKIWHDGGNIDGIRPAKEKFAENVVVLANGQELSDDVKKNIQVNVMDLKDHPYVLSDNVIGYEGEAIDYSGMDAWIVVISGLPTVDASNKEITYTISEKKVPGYELGIPSEERGVHFNQDTYFELTNTHEPTGGFPTLNLEVTKSLIGRELANGEFRFELKDANGVIETKACDANGVAVFSPLVFDTLGTHTFTVTEVATDAEGVTFDTSEYAIQVVVKDEGNKITATTTYTRDGKEVADVAFENQAEPSGTFEPVSAGLELTKTLEGQVLEAGQFTFHLYGATGELLQTKTNDVNGAVLFDQLTFNVPGTYTYQIREDEGNPAITYDEAYHVITFHVHDAGGGKLTVTKSVELNGKEVDSPSFHNVLEGAPEYPAVSVKLEAAKTLRGQVLEDGQFSFNLDDADGKTIQTKANDKNGVVLFDPVSFTKEGTYTYRVREVDAGAANTTYDEKVHVVTITVKAVDGKLTATTHITVDGQEVDALSFGNEFDNGKNYDAIGIKPEPRKVLKGRTLKGGEFSFKLDDAEGETIQVKKNAADGSIVFDAINVDKPGTYVFTMAEVQGNEKGVTYDDRAYLATIRVREGSDGKLAADPAVYTLVGKKVASATFENSAPAESSSKESSSKESSSQSSLAKTGDRPIAVVHLMVAGISAAAAVVIARRKKVTGR